MAKIKVHNLASEVGKSNRDIIDYLTGKGYESVTAVSAVPDSEIANIRAMFGVVEQTPEVPEKTQEKAAKDKAAASGKPASSDEESAGKPKKKSGIVRVVRQQNATRQLQQRRPKKQAPPKAGPAAGESAARTDSLVPDEMTAPGSHSVKEKAAAPEASAPEAEAVSAPVSAPSEVQTEKANASGMGKTAGKSSAPSAASETGQLEEKGQGEAGKAQEAASEAPAPAVKKEEKAPEAKTEKEKAEAPQADKTAEKAPAAAAEEAPADTGFRNGRVLRSFGAEFAQQMNNPVRSSRDRNDRGDRNGSRSQGRGGAGGRGQGQNRDNRGGDRPFGQGRRDQGAGAGQGAGRGDRPYGQGRSSDRPFGQGAGRGAGQGAAPGKGAPSGRGGQMRTAGAPSGGRGDFAARGGRAVQSSGDGALAHKTTRDFRKDGKDRERSREERRELGHGRGEAVGRNTQGGKKQFNRVPKALQNRTPVNTPKKEEAAVTEIRIPERITVRDLAERMHIPGAQIVKELFMKGDMVTLNHELPYEKAEEIAIEHDIICEKEEREDVIGALLAEDAENESEMTPRPPVVCVMGHVDHGKTSLLDAIRNTNVTDREAGGITQHIGAYMVSVHGQKITFLDTPGHEAFTAMRMRGANATDIAVLVVAADDGVMPQTVEAINHAKAAEVEIIVAVNKIDKPGANVDRVKQELTEYGLIAEDWGGSTVFCPVSAKTQEGIDNLLEMILLTAEVQELKANANRKARGIVLEAKLDKGRGPVASILIQKGTLRQGDFIACGAASGKVRAMTDEKGKRLQKATPSMPVEIIGLSSVPEAGEVLVSLDSDKEAKEFAAVFVSENKKNLLEETKTQMSLDDLFNQIKEGSLKELPIVVKADVQGSVEAVSQSLLKLSNDEVVVKVIHGGVGAITESDVSLASASNAVIIGFNVRPDNTAKMMADNQKVDIHLYNVIYEAIEDVERALKGMRAAVYEEKIQGHAEIRQIFKASGVGNIAGAYIKDGIFTRSSKVRVFRGTEKLFEGELASLKRFKDDVKEVREGYECGFVFDGFGDFEVDDTVEAYTMVEVPRE